MRATIEGQVPVDRWDRSSSGEVLDVAERVVVSPATGVFVAGGPGVVAGSAVASGDVLGHVRVAGGELVAVTSRFAGRMAEVVAWPGERVQAHQRVAWLRAG